MKSGGACGGIWEGDRPVMMERRVGLENVDEARKEKVSATRRSLLRPIDRARMTASEAETVVKESFHRDAFRSRSRTAKD